MARRNSSTSDRETPGNAREADTADKPKIPVLRADRIYGHAAPDRMHARDKADRDMPTGTKVRQPLTQPPLRRKKK